MSIPPPKKKPSGGRPLARRIFSKDSQSPPAQLPFEPLNEQPTTTTKLYTSFGDINSSYSRPWTDKAIVQSPQLKDSPEDELSGSYFSGSSQPSLASQVHSAASSSTSLLSRPQAQTETKRKRPVLELRPKDGLDPTSASSSTEPSPPISPSRARWNQLREHVRTASIKDFDVPSPRTAAARAVSPVPSFTSFSHGGIPTSALRSATPKPSRLGLFRFGQVVNEARSAADRSAKDFADDVRRACWAARSLDTKGVKMEREATQVRARDAVENTCAKRIHRRGHLDLHSIYRLNPRQLYQTTRARQTSQLPADSLQE